MQRLLDEYFKHVIDCAVSFMSDTLSIELVDKDLKIKIPKILETDTKTVILSISRNDDINFLIGFSYEYELLRAMAEKFGLPINEENEIEMLETTACEVANIIAGNAIVYFPNGGDGVMLTPPLIINGIKTLNEDEDKTHIAFCELTTTNGKVILDIINN